MTVADEDHPEPRRPRLRVLESVAAPGPETKYIDQVIAGRNNDTHFIYFSWRTLLFGKYDVFHVHWPEFLLRGKNTPIQMGKRVLFRVAVSRLSRRRVPIVRTLHNLEPHSEGDRREREMLGELDKMTSTWVRINETTDFPENGLHRTILHGDYRQRFEKLPKLDSVVGRFVYAGRIEPYKGIESLVGAFSDVTTAGAHLRIVGKPTESLKRTIMEAERRDSRISSELAFVPDGVLVQEITLASLVVLPYSEMHNSGILLVVLSLNRPALVPWSHANEQIANEVGPEWVKMFRGPLTSQVLEDALSEAGRIEGIPDLSGRSWDTVGTAYARVFRDSVKARSDEGT